MILFLVENWGYLLLGEIVGFLLVYFLWCCGILSIATGSIEGRGKPGHVSTLFGLFTLFCAGVVGLGSVLCQIGWVVGLTIWFFN